MGDSGETEELSSTLTVPEKISRLLPVRPVLPAKDEVVEVTAVIPSYAASLGITGLGVEITACLSFPPPTQLYS